MPAIVSLGYVFWIVGGMEMIERLAYYGVKAVATLYAKDPVSKGGLGVTMTELGSILTCMAAFPTYADAAKAIPQGEAFTTLVEFLHMPPHDVTAMLYAAHNPGGMWIIMGAIGVLSAGGIAWYGLWVPGVMARQAEADARKL
ncbi:MAG: hypothetical protein EXR69_12125 [Myxococcales bacterium]|nr:hypothetical protein [Myxococcales bacterium]